MRFEAAIVPFVFLLTACTTMTPAPTPLPTRVEVSTQAAAAPPAPAPPLTAEAEAARGGKTVVDPRQQALDRLRLDGQRAARGGQQLRFVGG